MLQLLILADDFTGALDTGVQFSTAGAKTQVTTETSISHTLLAGGLDVLVIDTESRYLSPEDSYSLISRLSQEAKNLGIPYLYKKIDSALRGNIGSEIKAISDVYQGNSIMLIPSFPEIHRTVQDGILYIEGVPVAESIFGNDPYEPVSESNIIQKLTVESELSVELVTATQGLLNQNKIYLFDASTNEDMIAIGTRLQREQRLAVTVGCAGFAKVLADLLFGTNNNVNFKLSAPLTVVCGSVNPITQIQVNYSAELGGVSHTLLAQQLLEDDYWKSPAGIADLERFISDFSKPEVIIFETFSPSTLNSLEDYVKGKPSLRDQIRFKIGKSLGNLVKSLLEKGVERTFLFTGGDTLYQSMKVLGIKSLVPLGEVSPGVVLSSMTWNGKMIKVLTKSGGFGHQSLFDDINNNIQKGVYNAN